MRTLLWISITLLSLSSLDSNAMCARQAARMRALFDTACRSNANSAACGQKSSVTLNQVKYSNQPTPPVVRIKK